MPMSRTARIALLQLPAFSVDEAQASLDYTLARIDDAAREGPDLIALPEVTYPAYFLGPAPRKIAGPPPSEAMERIASKARAHNAYIAVGAAIEGQDGGYGNGAALFGRDGSVVGLYRK